MLLQLGTYTFEGVKLPDSWNTNKETKYSEIPVIGGKPTLQKTGESLSTVDLGILFSGENCNPGKEITALNDLRQKGEVLQLVDGSGKNYGKYVIKSIDEANIQCLANGVPILLSATISLLEYNSQKTISQQKGEALSSSLPIIQAKALLLETPPVSISNTISKGVIQTNNLSIPENPTPGMLTKIKNTASEINSYFNLALAKIHNTDKLMNRTLQLRDSLSNAMSSAQTLADYAANGEITKLAGAKSILDNSVGVVKSNTSIIVAVIGSREGGY